MAERRTRTVRVSETATLLHLVGTCGLRPNNPPDPRTWELAKIETRNDRLTFTYYKHRKP